MAKELCQRGIVADDKDIFKGAALRDQTLKLRVGRFRFERLGVQDAGFIAGFGADQLRRLQATLQGAGDDEVEAEFEPIEDVRQM